MMMGMMMMMVVVGVVGGRGQHLGAHAVLTGLNGDNSGVWRLSLSLSLPAGDQQSLHSAVALRTSSHYWPD